MLLSQEQYAPRLQEQITPPPELPSISDEAEQLPEEPVLVQEVEVMQEVEVAADKQAASASSSASASSCRVPFGAPIAGWPLGRHLHPCQWLAPEGN